MVTDYSLSNPGGIQRGIHPIALADSGVRWHCRAYDEIEVSSEVQHNQDEAWMTMVQLKVAPQPLLSEAQKQVNMMDKGRGESFTIEVRAAMGEYYIQSKLIDKEVRTSNPLSRPLYLKSYQEVKNGIFGSVF